MGEPAAPVVWRTLPSQSSWKYSSPEAFPGLMPGVWTRVPLLVLSRSSPAPKL